MLALADQFAGAPLAITDQASGSVVVAVGDGAMTISIGVAVALSNWLLSGGIWNDGSSWDDAALWEDI